MGKKIPGCFIGLQIAEAIVLLLESNSEYYDKPEPGCKCAFGAKFALGSALKNIWSAMKYTTTRRDCKSFLRKLLNECCRVGVDSKCSTWVEIRKTIKEIRKYRKQRKASKQEDQNT